MDLEEYISLNGKIVPVEYTNRVKHLKLYSHWDEFYIKCPKNYNINQYELNKDYESWMNNILQQNNSIVQTLKNKINSEQPKLSVRSKEELKEIALNFLEKYDYKGIPNNVYIRTDMNKSWATHSINHNITFSYEMSKIPIHLIEYVVFHELCHFQEFEHTTTFYKLMAEQYPNYIEYDMELNMYSYLILHNNRKELNLE